jgi:hypothetical protein
MIIFAFGNKTDLLFRKSDERMAGVATLVFAFWP